MKFYLFSSDFKLIKELYKFGVDGVLHTYNAYQSSAFINIPKELKKTNIKHMVAVRPYTISPQLLSQIGMTFDDMYGKGILQINLISGWIKENEKNAGGIIGPVNDNSTREEKSKYLVEYIDVLENLERKTLDYYVSVTNPHTFAAASKYNSKMIIDYIHFEQDKYDVVGKRVMVMVGPTNEDGSLVSHEDLFDRMNRLKKSGIKEIIFPGGNQLIVEHTLDFIKKYKNIESEEPMVE